MRKFILWHLLCLCVSLHAQVNLKHNAARPGDEIIKQQVEYKDPGRSGEKVLWEFSKLTPFDNEYTLSYSSTENNSLITGTEHYTRYYYKYANDSLLLVSYENPTTTMDYSQPELLLKFPLQYNDSLKNYYYAEGRYSERKIIELLGNTHTKADAYGMMILPNQDTIKNVLRIKSIKRLSEKTSPINLLLYNDSTNKRRTLSKDSINYFLDTDSIILEVETYKWYQKGYRYPIFEAIKSKTIKYGEDNEFFSTAFYYPPEEHTYLDDDEENLALLEENLKEYDDEHKDINPWKDLRYNFYPNPVETNLELEIFMPKPGRVKMQLTNRVGIIIWNNDYGIWSEGLNVIPIPMLTHSKGEYIFNMWFDEYLVEEKVLKK